MAAVMKGNVESVKLLVEGKANVYTRNENKATLWQVAQQQGNTEIIKILSDAGADSFVGQLGNVFGFSSKKK